MRIRTSRLNGKFALTKSALDASANWVLAAQPGLIEARYVRRSPDYFTVYLSSQTGCRQACRMCHLTATKQTQLRDVDLEEFFTQADRVLDYAGAQAPAKTVHFNFMARGEPLANPVLTQRSDELFDGLWERAKTRNLRARFLISTILPKVATRPLEEMFDRYLPELYYSLYSMDEQVRRRWLPSALPAGDALDRLAAWQRHSYKIIKLHHALIDGVNDSVADAHAICDAVQARGLYVHINIVRYNPPSPQHGAESPMPRIEQHLAVYRERLGARVQLVPRVGSDVYASCGMFSPALCGESR